MEVLGLQIPTEAVDGTRYKSPAAPVREESRKVLQALTRGRCWNSAWVRTASWWRPVSARG